MMATKICRPMKAMGMVADRTAMTMPKTGDFDQAATVAIENKLKKIEYSRSLATILAHRRTVSDRTRAEVLMISTGKIKGESHATGPAKCFRYPPRPWCLTPCQLK